MKILKTQSKQGPFTSDNTIVKSSSSILVNDSLATNNVEVFIDFVPRMHIEDNPSYLDFTIDTLFTTIDSLLITIDKTMTEVDTPDAYSITVVRELDNKTFKPKGTITDENGIYRLTFDELDFLKMNSRYSIEIVNETNLIVYKGKMIYTNKNIQNYRYTVINNEKMYI